MDGDTVQKYVSGTVLVQVLNQIRNAALATAALAHERNDGTRRDGQGQAVQHFALRTGRIIELDIGELNPTLTRFQPQTVRSLFSGLGNGNAQHPRVIRARWGRIGPRRSLKAWLPMHQLKDFIGGSHGLCQTAKDISNRTKGIGKRAQIQEEAHKLTGRNVTVPNQQATVKHCKYKMQQKQAIFRENVGA